MLDIAQHIFSNIALATIIAGLAWIVGRSGRHSALAHLLWVSVFLKLVTPPIAVLNIPVTADWFPNSVAESTDSVSTNSSSDLVSASGNPSSSNQLPSQQQHSAAEEATAAISAAKPPFPDVRFFRLRWFHVVLAAWAIGFSVIVVQGIRRFVRLQKLIAEEGEVDEEASDFVRQLVERFRNSTVSNQHAPAAVRLPVRISPMLFGIGRRTVIVCPEELWQSLTDEERQAFLAHETAHFCRRDHWVRWIEWGVSSVYWWLPFLGAARRQLEIHEEACCDSWAVRHLESSPRSYAEALLKAVDFISVRLAGTPRLASQMHEAGDLERRLRLVMKLENLKPTSRLQSVSISAIAVSLIMLHPQIQPIATSEVTSTRTTNFPIDQTVLPSHVAAGSLNSTAGIRKQLPRIPKGFWNNMPPSKWASFSLSLPSAKVVADSEFGIRIQVQQQKDLKFTKEELTTLVDLPTSQRIVIGSADGSLRVWDLEAQSPVSLIGRHADSIVSIDYHDETGLISADASGSVIRWNLQSGERLTSSSANHSIQTVRINSEGSRLGVLSGSWQNPAPQSLVILDAQNLESLSTQVLNFPSAVAIPSDDDQWLLIDWSGNVRLSKSERLVARIPKLHVSALVFASRQSLGTEHETGIPPR